MLISIQSEREWAKFCAEFLGNADIPLNDPRFASNVARVANRTQTDAMVATMFAQLTEADARARLMAADTAFAAVNDMAGLSAHPDSGASRGRNTERASQLSCAGRSRHGAGAGIWRRTSHRRWGNRMSHAPCIAPLFVPGHRPDRFEKAAQSGADAIILDLEDAVPLAQKDEARAVIHADFTTLPVYVRVNAAGTPWHADDLKVVAEHTFAGIILPKAELLGDDLRPIAATQFPVIVLIETARGISQARTIAKLEQVERLAFGSIDFAADLGIAHTREALLAARFELVLASKLAGLSAPIDGVTTSISDPTQIKDDARYARDLGFGGKLCIHPQQIAPARAGFAPSADECVWAERILASGEGAVAIDGAMVDEPVRIRARHILARALTRRGLPQPK